MSTSPDQARPQDDHEANSVLSLNSGLTSCTEAVHALRQWITETAMVCITSPAVHATATLRGGMSYSVVLCEGAYALVQPEGCSGWAQVSFDDLDVNDTDNVEDLVAAAIHVTFGQTR